MTGAERKLPAAAIEFREPIWREEVERFGRNSPARAQAERARKEIEGGRTDLAWLRCETHGEDGTALPGCRKLYVPLGETGASAAPFGFVFRLTRSGNRLAWLMVAFGERHPDNPSSHTVYERAHKRLHGRYP